MNFPPWHVFLEAFVLVALLLGLPPLTVALVVVRQVTGQPPRSWLVPWAAVGFAVGVWALSHFRSSIPRSGMGLLPISCVALSALVPWPDERSLPTSCGGWARLLGLAFALGVTVGTYVLAIAGGQVPTGVTISPPHVAVPLSLSALFALLLVRLRRAPSDHTDTPDLPR